MHTLDDDNPTEILIKAIKKHNMLNAKDINLAFREWNFYLATTPRQITLDFLKPKDMF